MRKKGLCRSAIYLVSTILLSVCLLDADNAHATNGYFAHGHSIKNKGLAGAGAALPLDSLAASANPAGMVYVGNRIDVGLTVLNPNREYEVTGTGTLTTGKVESDSDLFLIPSLGANWMLPSGNGSLGISIYGNGGMNTDYDTATFPGGSTPTGVDLSQLFVAPTYARKFASKHAFGITPVFAWQKFEAKGLQGIDNASFSSSPGNVTNNSDESSYGFGVRIGYMGEIVPKLTIGISYQSEINMEEFDKYAGLLAEQGDLDIPATWTIGAAVNVTPTMIVVFDVQKIYYSDIKSINNSFTLSGNFGDDNGPGFGWKDMTVYKLGLQWQTRRSWIWRAGFSYGEQPVQTDEVYWNILTPYVTEAHATFGFTKMFGNNHELDFALMHAFDYDVTGSNPNASNQSIKISMDQWEASLGYSWKF